jgi:hypothetical protein
MVVFKNEMGVCNDYHTFVAATLTNNMDVAGGDWVFFVLQEDVLQ